MKLPASSEERSYDVIYTKTCIIDQEIVFMSYRVRDANEVDWKKLLLFMSFLKVTINNVLMLEADDTNILTCYIDVALKVHADMKIYTGVGFTMGKGAIISSSTKKKLE